MLDMDQIKKNVVGWSKTEGEKDIDENILKHKGTAKKTGKEPATIGASICFNGELSGDEDFVIQGKVEGKINLANNNLTVGENGRIRADIVARMIVIEGQLDGDLFGKEKVIIRNTGRVNGNITSPRVTLEDGAKYKGSIEMDPQAVDSTIQRATDVKMAVGEGSQSGASDLKRA